MFALLLVSCKNNVKTEIWHDKRDNVVDVKGQIQRIDFDEDDVLIGSFPLTIILGSHLIVQDPLSNDYHLHVFDKNNFKYICSTAPKGEGPNEITSIGYTIADEVNNQFFVIDHGKKKIFVYDIEALIKNPQTYIPIEKYKLDTATFPSQFQVIKDDEVYAHVIIKKPKKRTEMEYVKMNLKTGKITPLLYSHPDIEQKRVWFYASEKDNIGVETHSHLDLMTIHYLDKGLKCNIYGPDWENTTSNKRRFYGADPMIINKYIVVDFSFGRDNFSDESRPTSLLVFDLDGNYIKTIEIGYDILSFSYDKSNHRLVFSFSDADIQIGYLDLEGII
jgi:hypothetical protein